MRFQLIEELLDGKTYLFRGVSNNKYQSNYSNKAKTDLKSRFYAWEIFDGIYAFGNVQVFELLKDDNILNLDESIPVEDFIEEYNLENYKSVWLKKLYGVDCLADITDFDYHDLYHARQLVATDYLETNTSYDGVCWYEPNDTPEEQVQIWNSNIVRKLPYKEAKQVISKLAEANPDQYDNGSDFWSTKYTLSKR